MNDWDWFGELVDVAEDCGIWALMVLVGIVGLIYIFNEVTG